MWESPVYKIKKRVHGKLQFEEITIDVTGSAPSMEKPGDTLENVFARLTRKLKPQKTKILDVEPRSFATRSTFSRRISMYMLWSFLNLRTDRNRPRRIG